MSLQSQLPQPRKGQLIIYAVLLAVTIAGMVALSKCNRSTSEPSPAEQTPASRTNDDIKVVFDTSRLHFFDKDSETTLLNR